MKTVAKGMARAVGNCTSVLRRPLKAVEEGMEEFRASLWSQQGTRSQAERMIHSKTRLTALSPTPVLRLAGTF